MCTSRIVSVETMQNFDLASWIMLFKWSIQRIYPALCAHPFGPYDHCFLQQIQHYAYERSSAYRQASRQKMLEKERRESAQEGGRVQRSALQAAGQCGALLISVSSLLP
jgi:hypothetical protein